MWSGISLESEESEYNAYMFYQLLEERTAHSHTLVEDIKITPDLGRIIAVLREDKGIQVSRGICGDNLCWICQFIFD